MRLAAGGTFTKVVGATDTGQAKLDTAFKP
jgi:hypothetical protein